MDSRLDNANREVQNVSNMLSQLLVEKKAAAIKLADTSLAALKAHMQLITSPANPRTIKKMTERIKLSKKMDEAEKERVEAEEHLKDIEEKIRSFEEKNQSLGISLH